MITKITLEPTMLVTFAKVNERDDFTRADSVLYDMAAFIEKVAVFIQAVNQHPDIDSL